MLTATPNQHGSDVMKTSVPQSFTTQLLHDWYLAAARAAFSRSKPTLLPSALNDCDLTERISAVLLGAAAFEAALSSILDDVMTSGPAAADFFGEWKGFKDAVENLKPWRKRFDAIVFLSSPRHRWSLDLGELTSFQSVKKLMTLRNKLVHPVTLKTDQSGELAGYGLQCEERVVVRYGTHSFPVTEPRFKNLENVGMLLDAVEELVRRLLSLKELRSDDPPFIPKPIGRDGSEPIEEKDGWTQIRWCSKIGKYVVHRWDVASTPEDEEDGRRCAKELRCRHKTSCPWAPIRERVKQ